MQSIADVTIELPRTGIVRFTGENSNGKSIFRKTLMEVVSCSLNDPSERKALINNNCSFAQLILEDYDGSELLVNIDRESSATYYELTLAGQQPVRRYILDKNLDLAVRDFGFHYNKNRNISLNLCKLREPLFMVGTNGPTNLEVLDSITTDLRANRAIENINNTLKELAEYEARSKAFSTNLENSIATMHIYDIDAETKNKNRYEYWLDNIIALNPPAVPAIDRMTDISDIIKVNPDIAKLPFKDDDMRCLDLLTNVECLIKMPDMTQIDNAVHQYVEVITALKNSTCPMCGRNFYAEESSVYFGQAQDVS